MARAVQGLVALSVVTACAPAAIGCGSHASRTGGDEAVLRVTEKDFKISAPAAVRAGDVRLVVRNPGPDDHELLFVRAPIVGTLPMRPDGVTLDEDAFEHTTAAVVESKPPGTVTELRLRLAPGRYLLLCNMSGHYLGGMHTTVVAR